MPPLDLVSALGRLLTDPALRAAFATDPASAADQIDVCRAQRAAFCALNPNGVAAQAEALIVKRQLEVAAVLPVLFGRLGLDADRVFRCHAERFWPVGHRRHLVDAVEFVDFVLTTNPAAVDSVEASTVRFRLRGSRLAIRWVRAEAGACRGREVLILVRGRRGRLYRWTLGLGL